MSRPAPVAPLLALLLVAGAAAGAESPRARSCHAAAATADGVAIWGGAFHCGVGVVADAELWSWNGAAWSKRPGPPIPVREDALLAEIGAGLTLFGGRREGTAHADLWRLEGGTWRALPANGGPGPIQHGAAAFDPLRKRLVVFGGAVGREMGASTFEWDGERWHEHAVAGPAPRVGHGMAWSAADAGVLLYGGFAAERFRDLWKWNGATWQQLASEGPTFTEGHVVTGAEGGVHLVGPGLDDATPVRVWRWSAGSFTALGEPGPSLAVGATAVYDARRKVVLYWGGSAAGRAPDATVHEFDGARWRSIPGVDSSPPTPGPVRTGERRPVAALR